MDLVVVSLEAWDEVWRRNQHLVAGLLRRDPALRVLLVEPAADLTHGLLTRRRLRRGRGLRPGPALPGVAPGRLHLLEPTKPLPRRLDRRWDARWARQVRRAAERLGMRDPVLWANDTMAAELLGTGWPALYDLTDDWLAADRPPAEHARLVRQEAALLARARTVVACSPALVAGKGGPDRVRLVPNAVDTAPYRRPAPRPADLPPAPVALYAGTVHPDRMDLALCERLGRELAGLATVVLVGPTLVDEVGRKSLQDSGVRLLGPRPAAEVPAYLVHADVLLVPHVVTPFTDSLDPIKRYEYAAARRPVVATPVAGFTDGNAVVAAAPDFPHAVREVLAREEVALPASALAVDWSDRVDAMAGLLAATAVRDRIGP